MLIEDQFGITQNLQMSPIPKTSFLVGTYFAVSYSKRALAYQNHKIMNDAHLLSLSISDAICILKIFLVSCSANKKSHNLY